MDTNEVTLENLFAQLGLDNEQADIDAFVDSHQLDADQKISEADFWSDGQRQFLKEALQADNHWAPVVDDLNALLHRDHS